MPHSLGTITWPDGAKSFFEFNGTVNEGHATTALRDTEQEVHDHWRGDTERTCQCPQPEILEVEAEANFGPSWTTQACRRCKTLTGPTAPPDDQPEDTFTNLHPAYQTPEAFDRSACPMDPTPHLRGGRRRGRSVRQGS